jgi:lipoate-protein ligase A
MTRWRLVDDPEPRDGAWNMALDEVLFRDEEEGRAPGPVLRLYTWRPACLSLGYHQSIAEACDRRYCRRAGYDVVRRPTGGKAVLHADELTYSVAARYDEAPFAGQGLAGTYGSIAQALASALSALGLRVELTQRPARITPRGGAPCFLVPSEKEILVEGRKVAGSAQRRGGRAFLQHGALPLHLDYRELAAATGQGAGEAAAYRDLFAGLADLLGSVTLQALRREVAAAFRRAFPGLWEARPFDEGELRRAEVIRRERYADPWWTEHGAEGAPEADGDQGCATT